jgi:hypothetical protein
MEGHIKRQFGQTNVPINLKVNIQRAITSDDQQMGQTQRPHSLQQTVKQLWVPQATN